MLATLGATNAAIMRARSRDELFRLVSAAAARGGKFASMVIALAAPDAGRLTIVAMAGASLRRVEPVDIEIAETDGPAAIIATAYRDRRPVLSTDAVLLAPYGSSAAAVPLVRGGEAIGVLAFSSSQSENFTPDFVELLQRLAENIVFALDNFERGEERRQAEAQRERLTRMFAALSDTNEAIIRARTRDDLFRRVCRAAVHGGKFTSTIIALAEPGEAYMRVVAWAGPKAHLQKTVQIAVSEASPEGLGMSGRAFRTMQPCVINDYLADARGTAFHERARREGNRSGASLPLISNGRAVGVLVFLSSEVNAFTPDLVELLHRLANNVSFALENFQRAEEKARADERVQYLATHDGLTGLPNRANFNVLLHEAIRVARRAARRFAVLFIDVDRFKVINDSLGHVAGDELLVEIAARLGRCLEPTDVVARLGGDEFVVVLKNAEDAGSVGAAAREILRAVSEPLLLCGVECRTTASIGIALYPSDGEDEATLTKNADVAMYRAKEEGKNGFRFFSARAKPMSVERLIMESQLRHALRLDQFRLLYQPKINVATRRITGVEALLRWSCPERGEVPPDQFIAVAEETGLIVPIGRWVLNEACQQAAAWRARGLTPISMAVNLSPRQFSDGSLSADIDAALTLSGMQPELLQIEITESTMMRDVYHASHLLEDIRSRGIRIAIDDFGTGYSSMSLLKKLPVDTIKIDRSFVRDLPRDSEDAAIAQAVIGMAKALKLSVVAEGVETEEQAAFLADHACDEMQGYLFSRPASPDRIAEMLADAAGSEDGTANRRIA